jgi:uncharacterized protein (TIGR00369 family)
MKIWQREINLTVLQGRGHNTLAAALGIEFIAIGSNSLSAQMPVNEQTKQALGMLHGGASAALAEATASTAANFTVSEDQYCVGLELNINHLRPANTGYVIAVATPHSLGHNIQVWGIELTNNQRLIAVSRLTMIIKRRNMAKVN